MKLECKVDNNKEYLIAIRGIFSLTNMDIEYINFIIPLLGDDRKLTRKIRVAMFKRFSINDQILNNKLTLYRKRNILGSDNIFNELLIPRGSMKIIITNEN